MDSKQTTDIPLPEKIELLSSKEILGLLKEHRSQLQLYVSKFHPQETLKEEVNETKKQLKLLESKFQELENERLRVHDRLEECRMLEVQYTKKWQHLHQIIMEKYNDDALKRQLEGQMQELDDRSDEMERDVNKTDNLDTFLNNYILARTQYHLKREKLSSWNQQGNLKI